LRAMGAIEHDNEAYSKAFTYFVVAFEIIIIILYCIGTEYTTYEQELSASAVVSASYAKFQDVHVMIFVGFGFLMTFLKKYGFSAIGYNFVLSTFVIQLAILTNGFWEQLFQLINDDLDFHKIAIDVTVLIRADFAAGAVMITYGALLGKTSLLELFIIATVEMVFFGLNEQLVATELMVGDMGGSLIVHTFGAYFGLACSYIITPKDKFGEDDEGSVYTSDLFSMVGTVFLWMFWPSFNGALASGYQQHRVVVNTTLSLTASCIATFVASINLRPSKKFAMVDVQNATLAGGVAMGTCSNLGIGPGFAILIGGVAGLVSAFGYTIVTPWLLSKKILHDTCGVHNLHGMPGLLGGIFGAIATACGAFGQAGESNGSIFGAMDASSKNRSSGEQALYQFLGTIITLAVSIITGLLCGALIKALRGATGHGLSNHFHDGDHWDGAFSTLEDNSEVQELKLTVGNQEKVVPVKVVAGPVEAMTDAQWAGSTAVETVRGHSKATVSPMTGSGVNNSGYSNHSEFSDKDLP